MGIKSKIKRIIICIIIAVSLFGMSFIPLLISNAYTKSLYEQYGAERWDEGGDMPFSQVSCFFAPNSGINEDMIISTGMNYNDKLTAESISAPDKDARLWLQAYSGEGNITVSYNKVTADASLVAAGGDFFFIHSKNILSGYYFNPNSQERVIILDENVAWKLFGALDIAGKDIYINDAIYTIAAVIASEKGLFSEETGADKMRVYMPYFTALQLDSSIQITSYEVILPNPVSGFAKKIVEESFSGYGTNCAVIENTDRFSFFRLIDTIGALPSAAMRKTAVIYPYWENVASGVQHIAAFMLCLRLLLLSGAFGLIFAVCIYILPNIIRAISFKIKKIRNIR